MKFQNGVLFTLLIALATIGIAAQDKNKTVLLSENAEKGGAAIQVSAPDVIVSIHPTANAFNVPITVTDLTGLGVLGYRFQIAFDPTVIQPTGANFGCVTAGTISASVSVTCNLFPDANTLTVFAFGVVPLSGSGTLINLTFLPVGENTDVSPLNFVDFIFNEGGPADPIDVTANGSVTLVVPTAAGVVVSGQVVSSGGVAIGNARVYLSGPSGEPRMVVTNPFGYFAFSDIPAGQSYVISTNAKGYSFAPLLVDVGTDVTGLQIVAEP